ncbi:MULTISPECIES: ParB/RepB/Spo0J family partition protein [Roseobacteraceae]|uniref:ParB/RepB/Spo0J family partition protein n=1 Tax=Roseobacteraceae TaxID=2854170 RepID=UPI0013B5BFF0|nr:MULTISPECIES: ParB/RepB/Spo0J family partition protein [Roseobacteraceae]MCA0995102.1 ParB/RepB/Spo0J family partition protein [Alloyangia pacifica]NDW00434.1 ParB N-terminal domain-containing protein [Salipiger sp. PrR002]NDW56392.1 ParB N-terminal domain-containing protein [Salipiger sp. PrR004]
MAKRRKLEAPSAEDLSRYEEEFRRETAGRGPLSAPIAQVAAEAATLHDPRPPERRAEDAKDRVDAERMRDAEGRGLLMLELAVEDINADALVRDRVVLDVEEMEELKASIAKGGLRLPVEVFATPDDAQGFGYGLLSGYRRLKAVRDLYALTKDARYAKIKAVIRDPEAMGGTFAAMIEENEIRANLSHYERGRIAVIAAQQGAFVNAEEAVNALFPMASKAKRSKIRSFALIFEELGDMLTFPDLLKEKDGLRIAAALRDGAEVRLREALAEKVPETPAEEAEQIAAALDGVERKLDPARGGRPKKAAKPAPAKALSSGLTLQLGEDTQGWYIRVGGKRVGRELMEAAMFELERLLEAPGK